jgi:hypothetical protein
MPDTPVFGPESVIAVTDGHGSARSFRSDIGAKYAAYTAHEVLQGFLNKRASLQSLSAAKEWAENRLPREIARTWRDWVQEHVSVNPFTKDELTSLREKEGDKRADQVENEPVIAYGSTLLCALLTAEYIIYAQLGDGDILAVAENGEVSRPIPKDERLIANETTSLCLPKAWEDFRVVFQPLTGATPALIMLATDGYANSYRSETEFLKVGTDFLNLIRSEGIELVNKSLRDWLTETSAQGSGDDITVGIICQGKGITPLTIAPEEPENLVRQPHAMPACARNAAPINQPACLQVLWSTKE